MALRSDPRLLALHTLRIKGVAEADAVAEALGLPVAEARAYLEALAGDGLVVHRDQALPGWTLTVEGRREHERMLAAETRADAVHPRVEAAYGRFRHLNPEVLEVCSRWQVRSVAGRSVLNDHRDPRYDASVIHDLEVLHRKARPVCARLAETLDRYRPYGPRLDHALRRVQAGEVDYFTKPMIPSYHTVWFELHEDLLATLGLDRSDEAEAAS